MIISPKCYNLQNQGTAAEKLRLHISEKTDFLDHKIETEVKSHKRKDMTLQELSPCKQTSIKNCFRSIFFFKSYALTFCTRSQITWRYFFPVFHYFNSAVLRRLHRIPSKLHMSKLMDHKPSEIMKVSVTCWPWDPPRILHRKRCVFCTLQR